MDEVAQGARLLAARYELGPLIGRGGMSDVHVATDAKLGRRVAVKLLKSALASDPVFRTRFRHEAQAAARMAHPTIVRVFDAGEEIVREPGGGETIVPYIVMEYVEGRLLKDIIADGPLPVAEAARIAEGILTALEYSHRAGVVHRDIKPGNVMVTSSGQVKVMDFGIARAISDSAATVAQTSSILGTAQYFSPEQARGETVDARTDLYASGVVLFEMLTGRAPFHGESAVAVAYQHVSEAPPTPSSINPQVSAAMDAVVLHALAKDRFERFQTASDFRNDVTAAATGQVPPKRVDAPADFTSTLFGVNPHATADTEAAMRQLSVDDEERRARTQSRPPVAWMWAGIAVVGVVIAAVLFWALNLERTPLVDAVAITVPDVVGLQYDEGGQILLDAELQPEPTTEVSDTVPEGEIISTDPAAGITVSPGQVITVVVSSGPQPIDVPSLTLLTLAEAQALLAEKGLVVGTVTAENSSSVSKDVVIRSDPESGTELRPGDSVNLVVSTGLVRVPDVRDQSVGEASTQLTAIGLQVAVEGDGGCTGGLVTAQSLPPGDQPQGSPVTLRYCSGT
ncbi:Stk1 family PASTA domain-containing Ser/Thr kinase [Microcella sp.]|uniref:Stk1 family PASTA domain-containing Ser/Thr kinase n=1 Tax=Microcella sp. TaxID=1913979 RepID=UPI00299F732A|nr:Stk1 family PASTA domain-containing Ser/Thr kinase [Microcella sp.]MDX2026302.1 Stk1 family PASTA domain-containing Ser/Thr kinase [Microcella sp.]